MRVNTFDELLPLYVRARQKIRNQRNELRALNKTIKWEHAQQRLRYIEIERIRRLWDEERKRKMPPAQIQKSSIFLPLVIGIVLGFILEPLLWLAIQ